MFNVFDKKLVEEGGQAKINIYDGSQNTLYVYADAWQSRLNVFNNVIADVARLADAVQATSDGLSAPELKDQTGSGSQGNAGESFL